MVCSDASWFDLHRYVTSLREHFPERRIWSAIRDPDQSDLDRIVLEGWKVWPKRGSWTLGGALDLNKKKIYYKETLSYKNRDITLCHELAHMLYPTEKYRECAEEDWECTIEWIGRGWRRKASVLRMILQTFHVPTKVYDSVTRKAFPEQRRPRVHHEYGYEQLLLPCLRE
ncbi:hypothetical protein EXS74_00570 [Candidatus Woesearchaeota archaeon]|nr:hypothetical protein [Candidatus Woesearchaeota archaeon]